jgi:hypothetical protein
MDGLGGALGLALFIAFFVKAALDKVAGMVRAKWPMADLALPFGVAAIVAGGLLSWFAQVNVFAAVPIDPTLGRILTAVAVGLGVEFLNDVTAIAQGRRSALGELAEVEERGIDEEPEFVMGLGPKVRGW